MADGLIIGTPNYLGEATAAFRALYERLIFRSEWFAFETENLENRLKQGFQAKQKNADFLSKLAFFFGKHGQKGTY